MTCEVLLDDFIFRDRFIDLTDMQYSTAIQMVNAQFPGVPQLWSSLPPTERDAKRKLCMNYLIGWQLASLYPDSVDGLSGMGSIPLKSKHVGPVTITYRDTLRQGSGVLELLTTNEFGIQALLMIQSAPENYVLYR